MHMADALVSPAVGGAMWAVSAGLTAYSLRLTRQNFQESRIPVMGVMGAFIFAAQMINFSIPGTGSSGHIGGAMLLAAVLGPAPAFLVMAAVLMVQALFFADGGLLAWGCNLFNMAFFSCFVAYPLIYRPLFKKHLWIAAVAGCVVSLQLGAFAVVLETLCSGITALPFSRFVALMQPIHLAIGATEGVLTALTLRILFRRRSDLAQAAPVAARTTVMALALAALVLGGGISLVASSQPDGLEWAIERTAGTEPENHGEVHRKAAEIQSRTAVMPDYALPRSGNAPWETSLAGIAGGLLALLAAGGLGRLCRSRKQS